MVARTKTGIKNFDKLIKGGFPEGSISLLTGTPGTGKTIFAMEYLYRGAKDFNHNGLYVTFEEKEDALHKQAAKFGWNLKNESRFHVMSISAQDLTNNTIEEIKSYVKRHKINRLVIDSLSALLINTPMIHGDISKVNDYIMKRFIYAFINQLRELKKCTTLLISQTPDDKMLSIDGVSEFICDGLIHITYESMGGDYSRSLSVRKMRQVDSNDDIHPLEISNNGIIIHDLK